MLIQDRYGICPKIWPPGAVQNYPGLAHWIGRRAEKREQLGEEMRLLYVAVTRARDTLLLTGTTRKREPWQSEPGRVITDREVVTANSYLDWLWKWLSSVTTRSDWTSEREGHNALLRWRLIDADDPTLRFDKSADRVPSVTAEESISNEVLSRVSWRYSNLAATCEPAVKRVSELIWSPGDVSEEQQLPFETPAAVVESPLKPSRRRPGKLTAADVGNAHHWYLQTLPLDRTLSASALGKHAQQLVADRVLTREEADALDLTAIAAFWNSPVGQSILSRPEAIQREVPFTARFSPEDLAGVGVCPNASELPAEFFVTRGAVDLVVLLREEVWILDFKTDRIDAGDLPSKTIIYGRQLKLYGLALGRIYRRQVRHRWLHFLSVSTTVEI
jgi:ATP-dependent helicase/nuclease subunit A